MQVLETLQESWAQQSALRHDMVHWRWFEPAVQAAMAQAAARNDMTVEVHGEVLCQVFFDWVHDVESHQHLENLDPLDFRHAIAGLLLRHLFAAQYPASPQPLLLTLRGDGAAGAQGAQGAMAGSLITSVVLTLLQALRLQAGAPTFTPDVRLPQYWDSYLENAAQQPATAICFLDRIAGLEPVWQTPTLLGERPAMRAAMAASARRVASG